LRDEAHDPAKPEAKNERTMPVTTSFRSFLERMRGGQEI
jgi:hypothetical protein